ncbi:MAG: SMP-30/gluconolactonase/LRE family protein [Thermomicrobiales bacterium]|nr:SMP-30/gluconolactonase/LRE family protein [Thermomicrobiales bacterium]
MTLDFKPLDNTRCTLGEGPAYDDRRDALWWCDILERAVHVFHLHDRRTQTYRFESEVGSIGIAETGRLVVALRHEVGLFDPDSGVFERIAEIEANNPDTRLNDGKVGPDGAFWVGTMDDRNVSRKEPLGSLYRVDASGRVEKKIDGLMVSNGLAFSPDGRTMFHSDSRGPWIDRWHFDPSTGEISGRRRIAVLDDETGRPDGGATDATGAYWSAGVSAARLNRFSPEGELLEVYPVPVAGPTMPCFGGPGLTRLFVTSLRHGRAPELLERYPLTGITIVADSPVAGSPVSRFRDA